MPSEPERYNIDEMMERLKHRSASSDPEEGELVQRADGTMAIKVRRRKRRSHQPHKEWQHRWRVFQVVLLLVILLGLLLGAGFLTIYANSSPFRRHVAEGIGACTGAEVEMQEFRMNPTGANATGVELKWPAEGILNGVSLHQVSADIAPWSMLGGRLSGRDVVARSGSMVCSADRPQAVWLANPPEADSAYLAFDRYSIRNLQLQLLGAGQPLINLTDAEAVLLPADKGRLAQWRMSGGRVEIRDWAIYGLERAHVEFDAGDVRVVGLRLARPGETRGGVMELSGVLSTDPARQPCRLDVAAQAMPISGFIGDGLGALLDGRVDCEPATGASSLQITFGNQRAVVLDAQLKGSFGGGFQIKRLPCLFGLSQILGDEWFAEPTFEDRMSCRVRRQGAKVELEGIELNHPQRMAVRGNLVEEAGQLRGRLKIGLMPSTISATESRALDALFGPITDGRRWVELELGGSVAAPGDNFSQLYEKAIAAKGKPSAPSPPKSQGTGFEELTRPR